MPTIEIIGLGPGDPGALTRQAEDLLHQGLPVYLRTAVHPTVMAFAAWKCPYTSFDELYNQARDFESLYQQIVDQLLAEAQAHGRIVYAVPGHPLVAETTVTRLIAEAPAAGVTLHIHPAVSCLDAVFQALHLDPTDGLHIVDGMQLTPANLHLDRPTLVTQVYSRHIASEVKLTLLEKRDPDFVVVVVQAAGCPDQRIENIPLAELDHLEWLNHLTTLFVPPASAPEPADQLHRLRSVVDRLRAPDGGCPWDLAQTPSTLRKYILEEAYETVDAIEKDEPDAIREELGDLLLQVFLQARIAEDNGDFDLDDVARGISDKLIYRHPHVFGDKTITSPAEVHQQWEELKAQEKQGQDSLLSDLPLALPALSLAEKIQKKAARVGFDWPDVQGVWLKIAEEIQELQQADSEAERLHELGDLLLALSNLARWLGIDAEDAMRQANQRFVQRFRHMENQARGRVLPELSLEEWENLWQQAKMELQAGKQGEKNA